MRAWGWSLHNRISALMKDQRACCFYPVPLLASNKATICKAERGPWPRAQPCWPIFPICRTVRCQGWLFKLLSLWYCYSRWTDYNPKVYQCSLHMTLRSWPTMSINLEITAPTVTAHSHAEDIGPLTRISNLGRATPWTSARAEQCLRSESQHQHLCICNHLISKFRPLTWLSWALTSWSYCFSLLICEKQRPYHFISCSSIHYDVPRLSF